MGLSISLMPADLACGNQGNMFQKQVKAYPFKQHYMQRICNCASKALVAGCGSWPMPAVKRSFGHSARFPPQESQVRQIEDRLRSSMASCIQKKTYEQGGTRTHTHTQTQTHTHTQIHTHKHKHKHPPARTHTHIPPTPSCFQPCGSGVGHTRNQERKRELQ